MRRKKVITYKEEMVKASIARFQRACRPFIMQWPAKDEFGHYGMIGLAARTACFDSACANPAWWKPRELFAGKGDAQNRGQECDGALTGMGSGPTFPYRITYRPGESVVGVGCCGTAGILGPHSTGLEMERSQTDSGWLISRRLLPRVAKTPSFCPLARPGCLSFHSFHMY